MKPALKIKQIGYAIKYRMNFRHLFSSDLIPLKMHQQGATNIVHIMKTDIGQNIRIMTHIIILIAKGASLNVLENNSLNI